SWLGWGRRGFSRSPSGCNKSLTCSRSYAAGPCLPPNSAPRVRGRTAEGWGRPQAGAAAEVPAQPPASGALPTEQGVLAAGAGAEMRRSLGTAVFGGMLGVTFFGIFLTPVFFYVIQGMGRGKASHPKAVAPSAHVLAAGDARWQTSVQQVEAALEALRQ